MSKELSESDKEFLKAYKALRKAQQKKERLKSQFTREREKERRIRARRLIEKGALLEKYFEAYELSIEETEELLKTFSDYVNEKKPNRFKKN